MHSEIDQWIAGRVLAIHRRNGGALTSVDLRHRLLEPALGLDSLDLAEVMAGIETRFRVSVFDGSAPRTWADICSVIQGAPAL